MSTTRQRQEAYLKANQILEDASYVLEGCMCFTCILRRKAEVAKKAFRVCYPKLRFVPLMYIKAGDYRKEPNYVLDKINELRSRNHRTIQYEEPGTRTYFCKWCGKKEPASNTTIIDGKRICNSCLPNVFTCEECGKLSATATSKWKRDVNDIGIHGQKKICADCALQYSQCAQCSYFTTPDLMTSYAYKRDDVGNFVIYKMCAHCEECSSIKCDMCGEKTHKAVCTQMNHHYYCPVCTEESKGIMHFDFKPILPRFQKAPTEGKVTKNALHFGFEIELGPKNSFKESEVMCHLTKGHVGADKIYMMQDGSISQATGYDGFEVASHPFTWEFYKKYGWEDWDKMCLFLTKHGWSGDWSGLGIHIHTTKAAWGTHQIYKLLTFIDQNASFVQMVAQRGPTSYCSYSNLDTQKARRVAKFKKNRESHHYNAINLNAGDTGLASKTIEFRMFQSTLEPLYFHKNIEFVYACYRFTRETSKMRTLEFKEFVEKNKRTFPCLWECIREGGALCV